MSGGSMNYLYSKVEYAEFQENTELRRAFRIHLEKIAKALRAIEWNDSGDGADREEEFIRACLPEEKNLDAAVSQALALLTLAQAEHLSDSFPISNKVAVAQDILLGCLKETDK